MKHTYTKRLFFIYLKVRLKWVSCSFCFLNMGTLLREEKHILFSFLGWMYVKGITNWNTNNVDLHVLLCPFQYLGMKHLLCYQCISSGCICV